MALLTINLLLSGIGIFVLIWGRREIKYLKQDCAQLEKELGR